MQRPPADDAAEKARLADAAKLAARKKKVDAERLAHIKRVNAEAQTRADPKRAAEIQRDTADAEEYEKNLPQNKNNAPSVSVSSAPSVAASSAPSSAASTTLSAAPASVSTTTPSISSKAAPSATPSPAPAPAPVQASAPAPASAPKASPESPEKKSSGGFLCCGGSQEPETADPADKPKNAAGKAAPASSSAPEAAVSEAAGGGTKSSAAPAASGTAGEGAVKSSSAPGGNLSAETSQPKASATHVPGGAAGQKTWIKPEGQKTTTYTPDGAQAKPLGVKKQVQGNSVQQRIRGLQDAGIKTVPMGPRKMKTPKIVTDTKESWDKEGNITREITRYITEIDGTKRTEKETVHIPAKKK